MMVWAPLPPEGVQEVMGDPHHLMTWAMGEDLHMGGGYPHMEVNLDPLQWAPRGAVAMVDLPREVVMDLAQVSQMNV